jgi:hypothetical protein
VIRTGKGRVIALGGLAVALGVALTLALAALRPTADAPPEAPIAYEVGEAESVDPDGGGWTLTTADGVEITVEQYVISTWSATALACEDDGDQSAIAELVLIDVASASHSEPPDPAQATGPVTEDLTVDADAVALGQGTLTAESLCGVHIAIAAGAGTGTGRTEPTINVVGTYLLPGTDVPVSFASTPDQAWGGTIDVDEYDLDDSGATVTISRDRSRLFDEVDITASADELATQLLQALTAATEVEVRTSP